MNDELQEVVSFETAQLAAMKGYCRGSDNCYNMDGNLIRTYYINDNPLVSLNYEAPLMKDLLNFIHYTHNITVKEFMSDNKDIRELEINVKNVRKISCPLLRKTDLNKLIIEVLNLI